jgi:hypothetical protein
MFPNRRAQTLPGGSVLASISTSSVARCSPSPAIARSTGASTDETCPSKRAPTRTGKRQSSRVYNGLRSQSLIVPHIRRGDGSFLQRTYNIGNRLPPKWNLSVVEP